ncbi:MAG: ROK family protein [Maioricimonas sp. JB049]
MSELYCGVDLGGTSIKCAFGDADGNLHIERVIPTDAHQGPEPVLDRIADLVNSIAREAGQSPASLGMGLPGLVDIENGIARFLPNLPTGWKDVHVTEHLEKQLDCTVRILNDVRTATIGELRYGNGKNANTMAFFAIGTGVGGGIVVDRKLRLGPQGAAGELGHQTIIPDGPLCGCGSRGCLETLCGAPAIASEGIRLMRIGHAPRLHKSTGGDPTKVSPKSMFEASEAGDEAVREVLLRAATFLGIGVANVMTVLHPDLVVLGGGVAMMGSFLIDRVREVVHSHVTMFPPESVRIEHSVLDEKAGVIGAVSLAAEGIPGID